MKMRKTKETITVINPEGQPPSLERSPMARRLDTLAGKTVYIVSLTWPYTHQFSEELRSVLSRRYPDTIFILKKKNGSYAEDDPKLWGEIQERGDGAILGIGH
jgi:hypothetical protein